MDVATVDAAQSVQAIALRLLAMREHSRFELARKLRKKCADANVLNPVLDGLEQQSLLSDERFVEHYIAMRVQKGYGPIRIRAELEERGISNALIDTWLDDDRESWYVRLQELARLKYADGYTGLPNIDQGEQARRARFFHSRGYPESLIKRYLWD